MTYTLHIATAETRDLVVTALRAAADQRTRVARKAAVTVAADKRDGKDVRPAAMRLAVLLAEAGELANVADELANVADLPVVKYALGYSDAVDQLPAVDLDPTPAGDDETRVVEVTEGGQTTTVAVVGDDGTSPEAQAIAALAGLSPSGPDDEPEDDLTGALSEDAPTAVEEVLPA